MEIIKKIDIHAHAVAFPDFIPPHRATGQRFLTAEELIAIYNDLNIEMGVLLPIGSPEAQPAPMTGEACAYIASRHPDRFVWFCGVDPRTGENSASTDLSYYLNHYKSLGAKGLGELTAQLYADAPAALPAATNGPAAPDGQRPLAVPLRPAVAEWETAPWSAVI